MNWKEELLDTDRKETVEDFLTRHLPGVGIAPPYPTLDVVSTKQRFYVKVEVPGPIEVLYLNMRDDGGDGFDLADCRTSRWYAKQGVRGLGAMALKLALAAVSARGKSHIDVTLVQEDGRSFWPHCGYLPRRHYLKPLHFEQFLDIHGEELTVEARRELAALGKLAQTSPIRAWRGLALCKAKIPGGLPVSRIIFGQLPSGGMHVILPSEPGTNAMLRERVKVLTVFRPVSPRYTYQVRELALG